MLHSATIIVALINALKVKKSRQKIKLADVKKSAARRGMSMADLARACGCSRPAVYFAIERPSRFGRVARKIKEVLDV